MAPAPSTLEPLEVLLRVSGSPLRGSRCSCQRCVFGASRCPTVRLAASSCRCQRWFQGGALCRGDGRERPREQASDGRPDTERTGRRPQRARRLDPRSACRASRCARQRTGTGCSESGLALSDPFRQGIYLFPMGSGGGRHLLEPERQSQVAPFGISGRARSETIVPEYGPSRSCDCLDPAVIFSCLSRTIGSAPHRRARHRWQQGDQTCREPERIPTPCYRRCR